jgi:hypothetical protein
MGAQAGNADGTPPSGDNNDDSTPSNRDVKNHPLFQQMTQQLAELKRFKDAQDAAEAERAQKAAEAEKNYAEATRIAVEKALKDAKDAWTAEQATKDARSEARFQLVKVGFKNDKFIKGLLDDFDPAKASAEEFAKVAASDKENALFLEAAAPAKKPGTNPDPPAPPTGNKKQLTDEEIVALRESKKAEDRAAAHAAGRLKWLEENKGKAV